MTKRWAALTVTGTMLLTAGAAPAGAGASPPAAGASAPAATLHPGVMLDTEGGVCTANFVFTDPVKHLYLGQAAHCSLRGAGEGPVNADGRENPLDFDGCRDGSLPLGTKVDVVGTGVSGTLAYHGWLTMARVQETDPGLPVQRPRPGATAR